MSNVLLRIVAAFLIVIVFVGANEHLEIFNFPRRLHRLQQILNLANLRKHVYHLRQNLLIACIRNLLLFR